MGFKENKDITGSTAAIKEMLETITGEPFENLLSWDPTDTSEEVDEVEVTSELLVEKLGNVINSILDSLSSGELGIEDGKELLTTVEAVNQYTQLAGRY